MTCRQCGTDETLHRIPFGKTGRYIEIQGCECLAKRMLLKYENTRFEKPPAEKRKRRTKKQEGPCTDESTDKPMRLIGDGRWKGQEGGRGNAAGWPQSSWLYWNLPQF